MLRGHAADRSRRYRSRRRRGCNEVTPRPIFAILRELEPLRQTLHTGSAAKRRRAGSVEKKGDLPLRCDGLGRAAFAKFAECKVDGQPRSAKRQTRKAFAKSQNPRTFTGWACAALLSVTLLGSDRAAAPDTYERRARVPTGSRGAAEPHVRARVTLMHRCATSHHEIVPIGSAKRDGELGRAEIASS